MKSTLPPNHGLNGEVLDNPSLLPQENNQPSLTDVQFDSLVAGVARGQDILVSAPTSTGKTLIGWWGVSAALAAGHNIVYLVSYRALAHQKFEEAQHLFLDALQGDHSSIVCATGDSVEDASGRKTSAPLAARILIATYEKFLGCLSIGGPPRDLTDTCFICDEVQLIGDKTRGQKVELLLTLLKRSGWGQLIGLSAVLSEADAKTIADWLELTLVRNPNREKRLTIECRSPERIVSVTSAPNFDPSWNDQPTPPRLNIVPAKIVTELALITERRPVIVFCMKVDETFELANQVATNRPITRKVSLPLGLDLDAALLDLLCKGIAYHNAELSEEERLFVENQLADGHVDIVFATSTLAAGVNFPLGSAVFASWKRWNFERGRHEPISRAEFQNMAGRVGRMGQIGDDGRVILSANNASDRQIAVRLMDLATQDELGSGIVPDDFGPLILQILAGKLCNRRDEAFALLSSTLSAAREITRNASGVAHWRPHLNAHINRLIELGCIIESGETLILTTLGEAVARSGLKPETAIYFIRGLARFSQSLLALLPSVAGDGNEDDLAFILAHAALASPEFNLEGGRPTRYINWRVSAPRLINNPIARRLAQVLFAQPWMGDVGAANGALLLSGWFSGASRREIEAQVGSVRLGTVQAMARDVSWILMGITEIVSAVTAPALAEEGKPELLRDPAISGAVRQLVRAIRRQATRVNAGLPGDILWASELDLQQRPRRLSRSQLLALHGRGLVRAIDLMDGAAAAETARREALDAVLNPRLANLVRDAARRWKANDREYCKRIHLRRAALVNGTEVIEALYSARGDAFETAFSSLLTFLTIPHEQIDSPGRVAHPDFLVTIESFPSIVVELKTKASESDVVSFNAATEVLGASELLGLRDHPCLTVCNPAVEPSVPRLIEACGRLCVLEVCDLAEAALRVSEGVLSRDALYNWLTTPGIALREDLPHLR